MSKTKSGTVNLNTGRQRSYEIDMTNGPILRKMLLFALPLAASSVLQLLFNAADVIVVGKFAGDHSLAAVGSTTSLIALLTNFFLGLSVGVNVLVARYHGAGEEKDAKETVQSAAATAIAGGVLIGVIGISGAGLFLKWMDSPAEVIGLASIYLRIYFLGMPAMMLYNFGAAILRAVGDTRRPLLYLLSAGVLNVILNLVFVIGLKMDVAGVAAATAISQCVSAFLVVRCLCAEQGDIHLDLRHIRVYRAKLVKILQIGVPAGLQSTLFSLANVMIQASINSFGAVTVAGSSASSNLEGFVYVAMNAFYQATLTFTGQNIGAGKYERVNRVLRCGLLGVFLTGAALGLFMIGGSDVLLHLYTDNPEVIAEGEKRLRIICSTYFLCGMMDTMVGSLRGLGYSVMPMIVSLLGACGLRLLFIFTLFRQPYWHRAEYLYMTYPVTWIITLSVHVICFLIVRRHLRKVWYSV